MRDENRAAYSIECGRSRADNRNGMTFQNVRERQRMTNVIMGREVGGEEQTV